jgi:hypothetical protein
MAEKDQLPCSPTAALMPNVGQKPRTELLDLQHSHTGGEVAKEKKKPRDEFRTCTHANSYWNSCVLLN